MMHMPALGLVSVDLWLTYLVAVLLALRLSRALRSSDQLVAVLARPTRRPRLPARDL